MSALPEHLKALGKLSDAVDLYEVAVKEAPDDWSTRNALGDP